MIVALARKLAIALWRYVETGLIPEGAHRQIRPLISKEFQQAHSPMVALVGGLGCQTVRPLGEGAVDKISPIPHSVMVHARSIVASRIGAGGYKSMRSLARDMDLIARPALGTKA